MLFCLGLTLGMVMDAKSDEFKLTPSLTVKEEYNDNILYARPEEKQKDFITTISPGLVLIDRTERMDLSLSGRLDRRWYSNHRDINATDQYYESTGKYALTPRLNFFGKALYSRDSKIDRDIETTGLLFTNVRRDRQNYFISSDYAFSEKTIATLSYDYLNDKYQNVEYADLEANTFNFGFIRDMSTILESTKARFNIGYAKYIVTGMKIDNYEAMIGMDHEFNEKWSMLLDGGGRYTRSKFVDIQQTSPPFFFRETKEKNSGWGMVGQLVFTYKGKQNSGSISAIIDLLPASGRTASTERTSFIFYVSRRFTYELYGTLSGGYYLNKSRQGELSTQRIDEDTIRINPSLRYEFDKDKTIEVSYAYSRKKYNVSGNKAQQNVFYIRFRMQHHLFE